MGIFEIGGLAVLALIDSTSLGTLVLPLFLLLLPQLRIGKFAAYLATISGFYFGIGLVLLSGARAVITDYGALLETLAAYVVQLVIGAGLFAAAWFVDPGKKNRERARRGLPPEPSRWERRLSGNTGTLALMGVALLAGLAELAGMLPYLAAVGILATAEISMAARVALLVGYVLVMVLPAVVLLGVRLLIGNRGHERLTRIRDWVARQASSSLPWILGIVGFLLARHALSQLPAIGLFQGS